MSDFVPDGYLSITSAVYQALTHWFREPVSTAFERIEKELAEADKNYSTSDPIPSHMVEIIQQKLDHDCQEEIDKTRRQLRNALHEGDLTAFYFSTTLLRDEPKSIPRAFWTSPAAGDVLKTGIYLPYGRPKYYYESRPAEKVLVRETELTKFLFGEKSVPDAKADQTPIGSMAVPSAERYLTPHISLMLQAIEHFAISATHWPKKDELKEWFLSQKLPDGTPITPNQAEAMATFARPPEALRGGNKRI